MNMLNSLILEGNIAKDVKIKEKENGKEIAVFFVSYNCCYKTIDGEQVSENYIFEVECNGHMVPLARDFCKNNRGIRIVGRLKQEGKKVFIVAEHMEFKAK